ncbi:MAG: hypothetical protein C0P72_004300 [Clostridia bacterium]|nr:hypothetical protein [Clostridia bacterium]
MPKSKEELLICAEHAADYIVKSGSTGFVSFILDMINIVREKKEPEDQKLQSFYKMLYDVRDSNLEVIGGGKSLKKAYNGFIDGFLKISKKSPLKYEIGNEEFRELNLEELYYVFGWVRRLVKAREYEMRSNSKNRNECPDAQHGRGRKVNGGIFNTQLQEQLKKLKEKF